MKFIKENYPSYKNICFFELYSMLHQMSQLRNKNQAQIDAKFTEVVSIFDKIIKDEDLKIMLIK